MSAVKQEIDWHQALIPKEVSSDLDGIEWLGRVRQEAKRSFIHGGFPARKQEAWRYSNARRLLARGGGAADIASPFSVDDKLTKLGIHDLQAHRIVFSDTGLNEELSTLGNLPPGIVVQRLSEALQSSPQRVKAALARGAEYRNDTFIALNTAFMTDGLYIAMEVGLVLDKPLEIIYLASGQSSGSSNPRLLLDVSEGAKLSVIERFVGADKGSYFQNYVEEVYLGQLAELNHYRLIEENNSAFHLSNIYVRQAAGSRFRSQNHDLSGAWLRANYDVELRGREARCELYGLYVVGGNDQSNMHTYVKHLAPNCYSTQAYKGILLSKGRAVFDGRIFVDKGTQGTDAYMANDNLILSDDAEVDSKPQLEIYTDDVKCSHGTTVGQIDPEQVYYLRSRGISEKRAQELLCNGFAAEIVNGCDIESLHAYLFAQVAQCLEESAEAEKQVKR